MTPGRQEWTRAVVELAEALKPKCILDFGSGIGEDLIAIHEALKPAHPLLIGIDNSKAMTSFASWRATRYEAPIAFMPALADDLRPDLIILIDVLEHIKEAPTLIHELAQRVPTGGWLVEATATTDIHHPFHEPTLRGWAPDYQLLKLGFERMVQSKRLIFWKRTAVARMNFPPHVSVCAYRAVEPLTAVGIQGLIRDYGWDKPTFRYEDALISRARSIEATQFLRRTASDVLLFVDDDIVFDPADAVKLTSACTTERPVIGAPYLVRSGRHLSSRLFEGQEIECKDNAELVEVQHVATGFMAIHRSVLEKMKDTLTLCYPQEEALMMWPFFHPMIWDNKNAPEYLSEDWSFCERSRQLGFSVWLDPSIRLGHIGKHIYQMPQGYRERRISEEDADLHV